MPLKSKNTATKSSSSCLNLLSCFRTPRVDEPEDILHASAVADNRNKLRLPCLPWPKFRRKKKKMKKTIPFDLQCATSSLSFIPSSNNNTCTPKDRNSKGWCRRKQKVPNEALPTGSAAPSRTASVVSMDRIAQFQPSPRSNPARPNNQTVQSDLFRHAIYRTATNHIVNRIGNRRLRLGAGLLVMVTSLGVMLVFGRTGAVLFLSSCWYIVPMVIDTVLSSERQGN
ncbi:hypothetical protein FCM35_KLT06572 [Carex littledalei]|uniref:Uncharacterized protein n=1 Tax=Carex littledalei TaxID=544730 RepID=A0A833R0Z2_9POAL|nr:hypothetical protein FCM35_KLT06572 [Carex littledalei]